MKSSTSSQRSIRSKYIAAIALALLFAAPSWTQTPKPTLATTAAKALLGGKDGVMKLRGKWHKWNNIPLMVTYHPSYLLRPYNQNAKREAWEDLKAVLHHAYD